MGRPVIACASLALALLGAAAGCRRTERPADVANRWMTRSCGIGEKDAIESQLRGAGPQLEEPFIAAFQQGPPASDLEEVLSAAGQDYDDVQAALQAGKTHGLSADDIAAVKAVSKKGHLDEVQAAYTYSYRAAALTGLGIVGGSKARDLLRQTESTDDSRYQRVAAQALRRLR